jgi:hypothetical protein
MTTDQTLPALPAGCPATHKAILVPLPADEGSGRDNYYLYDVAYHGETIVSGSRIPEFDACRALLARGLTGTLVLADAVTGKNRLSLDIERGAKLTVREDQNRAPRLAKWKPFDGGGCSRLINGGGE